jgi:hypothetical protein
MPAIVKPTTLRRMLALATLSALGALSACGGGGGGSDSAPPAAPANATPPDTAASAASTPTDPTPPVTLALPAAPDVVITPDSGAYATALSLDFVTSRVGVTSLYTARAQVPISLSGQASGLQLSFQPGSIGSDLFMGDLVLPAATVSLQPTAQVLKGVRSTQFTGGASVNTEQGYGASVQWYTAAGIGTVGLGHWKYIGDTQRTFPPSYFNPGTRLVLGAFLVGTPSSDAAGAAVASGRYAGHLQAGTDDGRWFDSFDQAVSDVSVDVDATAHRIVIRLSSAAFLTGTMSYPRLSMQWLTSASTLWLKQAWSCSGEIDPSNGRFSCAFGIDGVQRIQGRFFGKQAESLGGTFAMSYFNGSFDDRPLVVGGIVAKRITTLPVAGTGTPWLLDASRLDFQSVVGQPARPLILRVTAPAAPALPPQAAAIDPSGNVFPDVSVTPVEGNPLAFDLRLSAQAVKQVGLRSGRLQLRLCHDDPLVCLQPVAGAPMDLPFTLTTSPVPGPGVVFAPSVLQGLTYEGQGLNLGVQALIDQPRADGWDNTTFSQQQYGYTIVSSGLLEPFQPTGTWTNQEPDTFSQGALGFKVPDNTSVGLYTGVITIQVCGLGAVGDCLPVEQPLVNLPFQIEVKSWTDLRALAVPASIASLPNGRGNFEARRTLPITVDPARISVRWKADFPYNTYTGGPTRPGVGQGFLFGTRVDGDTYTLIVHDEATGQVRWTRPLPKPGDFANGYSQDYSITASNQRIFVLMGYGQQSYVLTVYDAQSGKQVFQRECPTCQRVWAQEYGQGWAALNGGGNTRPLGLWLYDDRTDTLSDGMAPGDRSPLVLNAAERELIRSRFFGPGALPARQAGVSDTCSGDDNLSGRPWLTFIGNVVCHAPAWGGVDWSVGSLDTQPAGEWPGYPYSTVSPLEADGSLLYIPGTDLIVRRSSDGALLQRLPNVASAYEAMPVARTNNLVFIGGEQIRAYDLSTLKPVWTLPFKGEVAGISNAGVLYVVLKLGDTMANWHIVAVNLLP